MSLELLSQEEKVVVYIMRARQAGITISYSDIRKKSREYITEKPSLKFSNRWIKRFLNRNGLSLRKATHRTINNNMTAIKKKIETFLANFKTMREKFNYKDELIINYEETGIFFDFDAKTVEKKGKKFVRVLQLAKPKQRLTCGLTICASGDILPSLIIYNNEKILECLEMEKTNDLRFFCTKSGWIQDNIFLYWLNNIIIPFVKKRRAILVFDTYSVHISKDFQKEIMKHDNLDIALIPSGMTCFLQPLDVSFNHSFKTYIHQEWKKDQSTRKEDILSSQPQGQSLNSITDPSSGLITKAQIKNPPLRQLLKDGIFTEARSRNKKDKSCTLKLVEVKDVTQWIDKALIKMRQERNLIIKSFKICGLNNNLDGSEDHLVHNYDYLLKQINE